MMVFVAMLANLCAWIRSWFPMAPLPVVDPWLNPETNPGFARWLEEHETPIYLNEYEHDWDMEYDVRDMDFNVEWHFEGADWLRPSLELLNWFDDYYEEEDIVFAAWEPENWDAELWEESPLSAA